MIVILAGCVAPDLYEMRSLILSPGEEAAAMFYEGEGVLVEGWCDGPGLDVMPEPSGYWPTVLGPGELAEVWVLAEEDAEGGAWVCRVRAGDLIHEFHLLVVEL